ncbi:MAG TPA: DEAD/DEAH box helicase family protein [Thermoanaerobaculia bacterium]|nr:DEAD/DEAH box helicase family protein [Thermoanaerobaculia bacterium]
MDHHWPLRFAAIVTDHAHAAWADGTIVDAVTPTTARLLRYWFDPVEEGERQTNFHVGQRQAILNVIYLHEVVKVGSPADAYAKVAPDLLAEASGTLEALGREKHDHPKYAIKMATGTGKTFVLSALLVWQYLNSRRDGERYSRNFLLVAPGLIVYDRLLDAFLGRQRDDGDGRAFETSDLYARQDLFVPPEFRQEVFGFLKSSVVTKSDIGRKVTGDGIVAITNWHLLAGLEDEFAETSIESPGDLTADAVLRAVLPVRPGAAARNDLAVLDRSLRGRDALEYLKCLPDLVTFNDEAHHIHEVSKRGEVNEVEWQKSLTEIARPKHGKFMQVDFSATPYNQKGSGRTKKTKGGGEEFVFPEKLYSPHIVVDFDLKAAIRAGLVKMIALDKRKELATLPLDFKAERDDRGQLMSLSEGQRLMLRAGCTKLRHLEEHFTSIDATKHPKMLVICEDTEVAPLVEEFLVSEGFDPDDVLRIDSNRKGEVGVQEWQALKKRLFAVDHHAKPKIVVSVLMLREGFDVSNICVIVPLRSSKAPILLEQVIGRGLRLMWREPEYDESRRENVRRMLDERKEPASMIDILSIVEHPAFQAFYDELTKEGLAVEDANERDEREKVLGDLVTIPLRSNFEEYDFSFPIIRREAEELLQAGAIDVSALAPMPGFTLEQLRKAVPENEVFISEEITKGTRFGDYAVSSGIMTATSYNEYLGRLVQRVVTNLDDTVRARGKAIDVRFPALQVQLPELARAADVFIRTRLFGAPLDPLEGTTWRVLLLKDVAEHVIRELVSAVAKLQEQAAPTQAEVEHRRISEVSTLRAREHLTVETARTIYTRTPFPSVKGGLERAFIEYADGDQSVEAFVKLDVNQHAFVRFRYLREEGTTASYHPDFMVRCRNGMTYLVETKADEQVANANVQRKRRAAVRWTEQINALTAEQRGNTQWGYVLLAENFFYDWKTRLATVQEMLEFAKLRSHSEEGRLL